MKLKKIFVILLTLSVLFTGINGTTINVQAVTTNTLVTTQTDDIVVAPGDTTHIKLPIQSKNEYILLPTISISAKENAPFSFSSPYLTMDGTKINSLDVGPGRFLEFDVKVKDTATIAEYPVTITFKYDKDIIGEGQDPTTASLTITLSVEKEKAPAQLSINGVKLENSNIGNKTYLNFKVTNEGEITAKSVYLVMDYGGNLVEEYAAKTIKIGDILPGDSKNMSLPVTIPSTVTVGRKALKGSFTYKTPEGLDKSSSYDFYVTLSTNKNSPQLEVDDVSFKKGLTPGDNFTLTVEVENLGYATANKVVADIDDASITSDGIIRNYYSDGIAVSDIKEDQARVIKIPLTVSKYATGGMKNLKLNVTYTDADNVTYTATESVFIDVTAATTAGNPDIVISKVAQTPKQPEAGDKVVISFYVENKSNVDASEFKIYADGLTNSTFIPLESDPYKYIDNLKSGAKVKISLPLIVSTGITEGLNNITIKYTYTGGEGSAVIPVRDVKNDVGSSSIPKLIISKYTTDKEELKAGSTFNFTYDMYNTNSSVAAKNITVTLTQEDNVFTVTQGSNSFFINKMDPGETIEKTVEMKVKSDATTKTYPITLTIEYEYEGIKPNAETGEVGIKKTETLNLNAEENARPVADNVSVMSYDGSPVTVGQNATLSFDFYNMGKATLNNVIATLEGDGFTKADGSMYFIGNVEAGASTNVQFDVLPNMEGSAAGTLKISYEDSNGETIEFIKEFTADIMPAAAVDPGTNTGGAGEVFNPTPLTKKAILPIWAFVLAQIIIFVIAVPVTRKIIIRAYKSKLRRQEQEQD